MGISNILQSLDQKDKDLFLTEFIDGTEIVYFLPSWKDAFRYYKILQLVNNTNEEELIYENLFKKYVLNSYILENDELPAGIISSAIGIILYFSMVDISIDVVAETLNKYREDTSYIKTMKENICSVFPGYKLSDLDKVTHLELLEIFASAEHILLERGIINGEFNFSQKEPEDAIDTAEMIKKDIRAYGKFEHDATDRLSY